jgi:hypothetical protein
MTRHAVAASATGRGARHLRLGFGVRVARTIAPLPGSLLARRATGPAS